MIKKGTAVLVPIMLFLAWNNVSKDLSAEDRYYISRYLALMDDEAKRLAGIPYDSLHYEQQLWLIRSIQKAVLSRNPPGRGIPEGQCRGPRQMYEHQLGLCFDRSYLIEKIAVYLGIPNRHISAFVPPPSGSRMRALFLKNTRSHALTEVNTQKGWLLLEPDTLWLALDDKNMPIDASKLKSTFNWQTHPPCQTKAHYTHKTLMIKGLYSRHGYFFPPFVPFPDVRWQEMIPF